MDLASLSIRQAEEGVTLTLKHPVTGGILTNTDGAAITLTVIGQDAAKYRQARNALIEKRPTGKTQLPMSYLEAESLELSCAAVIGWSDNVVLDGQALAFSPANVRRVFVLLPWIKEQVDDFVAERSHFLPASSAS